MTKEELTKLYLTEKLTRDDIANLMGCSVSTVKRLISKHGLNKKTVQKHTKPTMETLSGYLSEHGSLTAISRAMSIPVSTLHRWFNEYGLDKNGYDNIKVRDKQLMNELYVVQNKSVREIEEITGSTNVLYWLTKHQIPIRNHRQDEAVSILENPEALRNMYCQPGMTSHKVGQELGVSYGTVLYWLDKHDIEKNNTGSSHETMFNTLLYDMGLQYERNLRPDWLNGQELDFYIPHTKLAIEINGCYWHSDKYKSPTYHKDKTDICRKNGVTLLHFTDHQLNYKFDIVKSIIEHKLDLSERIYARACDLKPVDFNEAQQFLEENHMQGKCVASHNIGLYYKEQLVSLMTFAVPRFDKQHQYELIRFCNRIGHTVVGGASKLYKHFVNNVSDSIVSYASLERSQGGVYEALGMNLISTSKPGYQYIRADSPKVISRYQAMKHKLPNLLGDGYDPTLSERDNMVKNGWHKVYGCGNLVYSSKEKAQG
ncbi:Hef-like homing endonuclease [Vibrio phage VP-1]|uniref:Hef-like homing endonuclease n=1 Tax=Vibrio phage VP-1 TaxID=2234088 RepID=A0A4P2TFQ0_9CAUD|nr:Hef-like homing endonuclease [Vibrio phage VP-1]